VLVLVVHELRDVNLILNASRQLALFLSSVAAQLAQQVVPSLAEESVPARVRDLVRCHSDQ
jgi:hypothetical protein